MEKHIREGSARSPSLHSLKPVQFSYHWLLSTGWNISCNTCGVFPSLIDFTFWKTIK